MVANGSASGETYRNDLASDKERPLAEATTNTTTIIARADQHDIDLHKASDRVNFGSIRELDVTPERPITVDNGHLVAWDARLSYDLSINTGKSGFLGKLVNSQTTGEGVVLKFRGTGKVLVCSRNKGGFLDWILGNMPAQKTVEN